MAVVFFFFEKKNKVENLALYLNLTFRFLFTGLKAPPEYDLLYVQDVELNIRKNTVAHHTDEFDITDIQQSPSKTESLVVRRGQPFELSIHFNRPYDKSVDDLRIIFTFGKVSNIAFSVFLSTVWFNKNVQFLQIQTCLKDNLYEAEIIL